MKGKIHYSYDIELAEWTGTIAWVHFGNLCTAILRDNLEEVSFMLSRPQAEELETLGGFRVRLLLETVTTDGSARRRLISIEAYDG